MEQISIKVINENGKEILDFFDSLGCNTSNLDEYSASGSYYYNDPDTNIVLATYKPLGLIFESLEKAKRFYDMKEEKELKIQIPEGYEIDKENSTFECIKFKKKVLTYDYISGILFKDLIVFYIDAEGYVKHVFCMKDHSSDPNNCASKKQAEKLLAINKLMNVARYLNNGWTPNWDNCNEFKYYIRFAVEKSSLEVSAYCCLFNEGNIYFESRNAAYKAIEILGEETIKLALSTDY